MSRVIVHLDADAFFAAVEQAADPKLRDKPIAVGGEKRGIIASASYEARKFGVYTPMPTVRARKLCPKLIVVPGNYERYEQFSNWMFSYCYDFTPDVEQTSIDEGYFDLSALRRKPPVDVALTVRDAIRQKLKITVSEGIGSNKLVSAIASKLTKPAAFNEVRAGAEKEFLHPLPNKWLPGIGSKTSVRLDAAGLVRISQVAATPTELLGMLLGNQAERIRQYAQGIDDRPLLATGEPQKTFSHQETFGRDLTDEEYIGAVLRRMADDLFAKVREDGRSIRTLTVKVRYNDMAEDQVSESLLEPTDLEGDVYDRLRQMLQRAWKRRVSLRLVSLKLSHVYTGCFRTELPLEAAARQRDSRARIAPVIDKLRRERGPSVILRGHDFRLREAPRESIPRSDKGRKTANGPQVLVRKPTRTYVPLCCHSYYSFLDSTLSPMAIARMAKRHDLPAIALTDTGNLHGVVEFVQAAQKEGIKPIIGAELKVADQRLLLYAMNAVGYENLCRLLSRHAEDGDGDEASVAARQRQPVKRSLLVDHNQGLIGVSSSPALSDLFPGRFYQRVSGDDGVVACPAVHYGAPEDRVRYDILQSIRTLTLVDHDHPEKRRGGRYHFRTPGEMGEACSAHEEWIRVTREIADRCKFTFPFGKPQFPRFISPDGSSSQEKLRQLVLAGFSRRYGGKRIISENGVEVPSLNVRAQVEEELSIIAAVGYEDYFLITWDLLQTCTQHGIEWITRGSAADSLVCYCLGISDVCPIRFGLYFRRFLNKERMALHKLPDIDIDFAHDRKDDVVKLLFEKYGPERCAVVGGFSTFQARSAFADAAKVLGLAENQVRRFTEHLPWNYAGSWDSAPPESQIIERLRAIPECRDLPLDEEPYKSAFETALFLNGSPRHPKMHPFGVVLSRAPMHTLTPTFIANKGYATTHFDMDAVEAVGLVKMDILAQGGLAVMRDAREALQKRGVSVDLASLEPWQDPAVWKMISSGGARAVHHIESPAMTSLCQMANVSEIDGLIAIVSVIRPGAANEDKKRSFTRRYQKMEPPEYPHPSLEPCLRSTFGLVVYEEHILQICEAFAGLDPGHADVLRRALVKQKWPAIRKFAIEFLASALARGHSDEKIQEVWELVTGFNGYAFCKAHSTAYGVEAYQAAWLKRYYPAEFMAGVLTHGKGFYHPIVYVLECHRIGLKLLPPSVNEPGPAFVPKGQSIRIPVTRMKALTARTANAILAARADGPFASLTDFFRRVAPTGEEIEGMIRIGAFDEFGDTRTRQFWQAQGLLKVFGPSRERNQGWLIPVQGTEWTPTLPLDEPSRRERLQWEDELLGFVVGGHPLELYDDIDWASYCPVAELGSFVGKTVITCGLVVEQRIHHQVTGEPMKFLSLADWAGIVETELFAPTYRSYGLATVRYPVLEVEARVEAFENGRGYSLRVIRAGKPRSKS